MPILQGYRRIVGRFDANAELAARHRRFKRHRLVSGIVDVPFYSQVGDSRRVRIAIQLPWPGFTLIP